MAAEAAESDDAEQAAAAAAGLRAAAETAAAAVAAAEEAADAAREAADAAAMADEEAAPAVAAAGGVYRRPNTSTPNFVRLGFGNAGNNTGFNLDYSIYERLARVSGSTLEADPSAGVNLERVTDLDFTVEPVLATGWERPDDTTWVFDVRTDSVWHTGRPFDIDDVHYMFEAIREENVAGGGSPSFLMSANLDVGEAVDASTYRLTLTQPTGYIETLLEATNLVDRETYDRRMDEAVVVGNGPIHVRATTTRTVAGTSCRTRTSRPTTTTRSSRAARRSSTRSSTPSSRTLPPWLWPWRRASWTRTRDSASASRRSRSDCWRTKISPPRRAGASAAASRASARTRSRSATSWPARPCSC